jgi:hypothetical protein
MKTTIYVQLLNEGTKVFRPVYASKIDEKIYQLESIQIPEDEEWEFKPESKVIVEQRILAGINCLVAVKEKE